MTSTQTALMPVDPAVSPAQASRILTIRANLLPEEITAGRSARRTRAALIVAVVVVLAGLGGWYFYAVQQLDTANENRNLVNDQVARARDDKRDYAGVTGIIGDRDTVKADLKSLMANDLPWAQKTDALRDTATAAGVTIQEIGGTVIRQDAVVTTGAGANGKAAAATERTVATVTMAGTSPDKPQVAAFIDKLADLKGFSDPYLTNLSENEDVWDYSLTVKINSSALCGRFTTACPATGGN